MQRVPFDRGIHFLGGDHLVADHSPFRCVGVEHALEEDGVARELDADEARQPQIGGAGDVPLLAGRQVEVRAALGNDAVHDAEKLAAAADGEGLDSGDPRLFDVVLILLVV